MLSRIAIVVAALLLTGADTGRGIVVRGRVLLPDGRPAVGARVHLSYREISTVPPDQWPSSGRSRRALGARPVFHGRTWVTDAEGWYAISPCYREHVPLPSQKLRISAQLGDLVGVGYAEESPMPMMPDLRLERGVRVRGTVVSPEGSPVAGVPIRFLAYRNWEARLLATVTDASGAFTFLPIRRRDDWNCRITLDHPDHPPVDIEPDLDALPVRAVLPWGVKVQGRVVTTRGTPMANVQVAAAVRDTLFAWRVLASRRTVTDEDGRFEMRGLPAVDIHPLVYPGLSHPVGSKGALDAMPQVGPRTRVRIMEVAHVAPLVVRPTGTIRGRAVSRDGKPKAGVRIHLMTELAGPFWNVACRTATTGPNGSFAFPGIPPGRYKIMQQQSGGIRTVNRELARTNVLPDRVTKVTVEYPHRR